MARAVLTIEADTSSVVRAMGDLRGVARASQAAMTAEARRGAKDREKAARDEERARRRADGDTLRAKRDADRAATNAANRESRERIAAGNRESRERIAAANRESRAKSAAERRSAAAAKTAEREKTRATDAAERERTRVVEREARKRTRAETRAAREAARAARASARQFAGNVVSTVGGAGRAVGAFATGSHGMIQDARRQRAVANRVLGNAVRGAGGGADDVTAAQRRVASFVDQTGMSYADVAAALETGQARGSALEAAPGQTRAQALENALRVIREGNAAGADPGQLLAARGRLGAAGLQGAALDEALRYAMQAARRGSVEIDQIVQQGLPGASSLMGQRVAALGPNATDAQRQRAALTAFQESVAVQEVAASTGRQPGNTANTLANLQNFLNTPRRQEQILTNIRAAERQTSTATPEGRAQRDRFRALREAMFERDPMRTGNAMRMREGFSPLEFAARLTEATGGNAAAGMNILAGGGHGNAQSLLSNMRGLLTFLGGATPTGQTGGQRVREMMTGGGITNREMNALQTSVEGDELSRVTRADEKANSALTDNTSALVRMSNAFDTWTRANPLAAQGMSAGSGFLSGALGSIVGPRARDWLTGMLGRGAAGAATAGEVAAGTSAAGGGLSVGGTVAAGVAGLLGGAAIGSLANQAIYSDRGNSNGNGPAYTNAFSGDFWRGLSTSVSQAVRDGISSAPITAQIDPHTAAHARSATPATPR